MSVMVRLDRKQMQRCWHAFSLIDTVNTTVLLFMISLAVAFTQLITDPIVHPNLHPTLARFYHYLVHYHPRLTRSIPYALIGLVISLQTLALFAPAWHKLQGRIKILPPRGVRKSLAILDQITKECYAALLPDAWMNLKDAFPGLFIKVPDVRGTHWELLDIDENKRQIRLVLRYVHDPLFIKRWRLYPRKLLCVVRLKGKGVRSEAEFLFHADSAMDYASVLEIIERTNSLLREAIEAKPGRAADLDRRVGVDAIFPAGQPSFFVTLGW